MKGGARAGRACAAAADMMVAGGAHARPMCMAAAGNMVATGGARAGEGLYRHPASRPLSRPRSWSVLRARSYSDQRGQALVLGMLLAGLAAVALVRYFAVGQAVGAKARQLHVLDAAAYSGALVQARALNMLAYINRAHVGHQLAMAHLLTLGSWASLGAAQSRQLAVGNPPSYLIAMLFGAEHGAAYLAASRASGLEALAHSQSGLAQAYAAHDRTVRETLSVVQSDIVQGLPQARWTAMQAVLGANYPEAPAGRFELRVTEDGWPGYVQAYAPRHPAMRSLVLGAAALYRFLDARNHTASNAWMVDARCVGRRHQLRRRGATELDDLGRWQSIDTQSFHALRSNRWIGCYHREYAMGWGWIPGAASQTMSEAHVDDPPDDFSEQDFWRWVRDATDWDIASGQDNPLANSKAAASRPQWQGGGLPVYFDVAEAGAGVPLRFGVALRHPGPDELVISTASAAEAFFQRPQARADGRAELPNLFHPYWQARLAPSAPPAQTEASQ